MKEKLEIGLVMLLITLGCIIAIVLVTIISPFIAFIGGCVFTYSLFTGRAGYPFS